MLENLLFIIGGLAALAWSAERFIDAASKAALRFKLSMSVIGVVILGYGTSFAELFVSAISALNEKPQLALGNAFGSNVVNIGLILGITIIFAPVALERLMVRREIPIATVTTVACMVLMLDGELSRFDGVLMLMALLGQTLYLILSSKTTTDTNDETETIPLSRTLLWLVVSLVVMMMSSDYLVKGASGIASALGLSNLVIGLTVVAIGTSLPELASSIVAIRRKESDMVMGNIIGSCIFNILGVVGLSAVIAPITISPNFLIRDASLTLAFTLGLWVICLFTQQILAKWVGYVFVLAYALYTVYLIFLV